VCFVTGAQNAVWGGLMTAGAQSRGVLGAIVNGRVRDAAEHRAAGFVLFARGLSTVGQAPFTRPAEVQVPVTVNLGAQQGGGLPAVTVHPGDILVADDDGVVCVPKLSEQDVLRVAARGREVDARCLKDIQSGIGVAESFRRHRGKL
jgi:regulator of RNase E activity RraA